MNECAVCHRTSEEVQVHYCTKYGAYLCSKHKNQFIRHGRITDGDKENLSCDICGTKDGKIHWLSAAQKYLCLKHRSQFNRLGYFLEHTKRDKNIINICDDHAEILFDGTDEKALIDIEDVDKCSQYKWMLTEIMGHTKYVKAMADDEHISLHRIVMNAPDGSVVDHINRNGLDNRKDNLRFVTTSENCVNSITRSATGEKNIYYHGNQYQVKIVRNYKTVFSGGYYSLDNAIEARDKFITQYNKAHNRVV